MAILTTLLLAPYLNKAFHIDDTVYIWVARQIHQSPLDFYGFDFNWYLVSESVAELNKNPPGVSYYIALIASVFGWSEIALHVGFIPPAVGAILGTYQLAERMCPSPFWAALITLLTPVFLVSSTMVMCDTLLLCIWIWTVVLWVEAFDSGNRRSFCLAGLLASLSVFIKFPGINLVPLLMVYGIIRTRSIGWWCLAMLLPVAMLVAYDWYTGTMYGVSSFRGAAAFAAEYREPLDHRLLQQTLTSLIFLGGCYLPVLFFQPWIWDRWSLCLLLVMLGGVIFTFGSSNPMTFGGSWNSVVQRAVHSVTGLTILTIAITDVWKHRSCDAILLVLWIVGVFTFSASVNWTVNGRTLLPMAPAVSILLVRRLSDGQGMLGLNKRGFLCAAMGLVSFSTVWITSADYSLANSARAAAHEIGNRYAQPGRTLWSQGHWGFQYYAELAGAQTLDFERSHIKKGDVLICPSNNGPVVTPKRSVERKSIHTYRVLPLCSTWSRQIGAAFYWDGYGSLPFVVGTVPNEEYTVWQANAEFKPGTLR